jgi:acetate kinase
VYDCIRGLDILVFTGGIGEHAAPIRARVCQDAQWLGVRLNAKVNHAGGPKISADESAIALLAISTDEDLMIVRHIYGIINAAKPNNAEVSGSQPRAAAERIQRVQNTAV